MEGKQNFRNYASLRTSFREIFFSGKKQEREKNIAYFFQFTFLAFSVFPPLSSPSPLDDTDSVAVDLSDGLLGTGAGLT